MTGLRAHSHKVCGFVCGVQWMVALQKIVKSPSRFALEGTRKILCSLSGQNLAIFQAADFWVNQQFAFSWITCLAESEVQKSIFNKNRKSYFNPIEGWMENPMFNGGEQCDQIGQFFIFSQNHRRGFIRLARGVYSVHLYQTVNCGFIIMAKFWT